MRLVFLGSPEFAIPSLEALVREGHELVLVVSQPDKARGRGREAVPTPVRRRARELELPETTLAPKKREASYQRILDLSPEMAVIVAFGHIIREPLLRGPRFGCLNVHASLLPRWRGAAPIHRAIVAGDERTGVCTMQLEEGLDTGPIYARAETPIGADETAGNLHDRLAILGAELLVKTLREIELQGLRPLPQSEQGVSHAPLLGKDEGTVDFNRPANEVHDRIRGLTPWPGVAVKKGHKTLRLAGSFLLPANRGGVGEILTIGADGMTIGCADHAVGIRLVQAAGGRLMSPISYARGHDLRVGESLLPLAAVPSRKID